MKHLYSIFLALLVAINVNSLAQKGSDPNYKEKQERNHETNAHLDKAPVQDIPGKNVLRLSKDMDTTTLPFNENFETGNDYFLLNENAQSTALITSGIGVGDSYALIFTGKSSGNWPVGTTTASEA